MLLNVFNRVLLLIVHHAQFGHCNLSFIAMCAQFSLPPNIPAMSQTDRLVGSSLKITRSKRSPTLRRVARVTSRDQGYVALLGLLRVTRVTLRDQDYVA